MSEFLAEAQVLVTPNTKAFRSTLLKSLETIEERTQFKLRVVPDMKGFQATLRTAIESSTRNVVARVKVVPDTKGFAAAVRTATAGVTAPVKLTPVGGAGAAATGASTTASRTRAAQITSEETAELKRRAQIATAFEKREAELERKRVASAKRAAKESATAFATAEKAEAAAAREASAAARGEVAAFKRKEQEKTAALDRERRRRLALRTKEAKDEAKSQALASRRTSFAARGFGAQLATFAGLRGAVLSANAAFIAGTVSAIAFGKAVSSAAKFASQLNVFRVVTGSTAAELEAVSKEARRLGNDITLPGVNAQDAAEALTTLSKAGLSVQDSLGGARGVLQLATAAQISNEEATNLAASALNAFGLAGDQAVRVADVLTNAANAAQGEITDMGIALQQSSAVARQVGLSLEDTVTFITILARAGIRGSDAGTALRVAFTRLIAPTDQAAAALEKLNVQVRDAEGNLRPDVFQQIADAQSNLSRAQQDANAKIIFGVDALRAYSIITRAGIAGIDEVNQLLERQGSASELAAARMTGLTGEVENLKNQLSTLGLTLGEAVIPPLSFIATRASGALSGINEFAQGVKSAADTATREIERILGKINELEIVSSNPIEFIVDVAFRFGGGDGGDSRVKDFFKDIIFKSLPEQLDSAQAQFDHFFLGLEENTGIDLIKIPTPTQARAQIRGLIEDLNKAKGSPRAFNETVVALRKMQEQMKNGDSITKTFAANLDGIIETLVELSAQPDVEIPVRINVDEISSTDVTTAAKGTSAKFNQTFLPSIQEVMQNASKKAWQAFQDAGARAAREAGAAQAKAFASAFAGIGRAENQQLGFEDVLNQIVLGGGSPADQVANLRDQFNAQQKIIDTATKQLQGLTPQDKGFATFTEKAREARAKQVQILDQIEGIEREAASDAKEAADKIKEARKKADQVLIDAFEEKQQDFDSRAFVASQDETLRNDLLIARERKKFLFSRIAFFKARIKDAETLRNVLRTVRDALRKSDAEINSIEKEIADNNRENAKKARERQKETRDALTEAFGKKLQFAQLVGDRDVIIKAFDQAIADARDRVKNAKKLGLVLVDEAIALQQLINDRKEFLKQVEGDAKSVTGTTVFDLLKQSVDTFNQNAGSLIDGNQPFAGPTGFTADIAQFLQRRRPTGIGSGGFGRQSQFRPFDDTGILKARTFVDRQEKSNNDLIAAIDRWIAALTKQSSGSSTGGLSAQAATALGARGQAMGAFWKAQQSRMAEES